MSTAGNLVDRVYREWLYQPDDQPVRTRLSSAQDDTEAALVIDPALLSPEEQQLVSIGSIVEVDQELMLITANHMSTSSSVTVMRGHLGTTAAAHSTNALVYINPPFPRKVVFDAVSNAVVDLYPDLWHTNTMFVPSGRAFIPVPAETTGVLRARCEWADDWVDCGVRFLHNHPDSRTGQAVHIVSPNATGRVMLQLKQKFTRPTDETTELSDIEQDWEELVVLGAIINVLAATDTDSIEQDFITESGEAQVYPPGTGERLSRAAVRLYEYKLEKARRELHVRYPTPVAMSGVTYGGF